MNKNEKIRKTLKAKYPTYTKNCEQCGKQIEYRLKSKYLRGRFCNNKCAMAWKNENLNLAKFAGLVSAATQVRRSKNEIHFADLCKGYFDSVLTNEPIFNGWDADVIIEDIKTAVLWNGIWHYKKITKGQPSLEQIRNRERIKVKEIKKAGYTPYIIKDMGSENREFVKEMFMEFLYAKIYVQYRSCIRR